MTASEKVNILVVDDHLENLVALEAILKDLGQHLVKASSGAEALRYLLGNEAAVILLDVEMPGMDGLQTATLIRERERTRHTPIIFLTAATKTDLQISQGYSIGGVDYIFKPFAPNILRSKVAAFVEMYRQSRELRRQSALLKTETDFVTAVLDTVKSLVLVLDADGKILRVNRAWEQMTGFSEDEATGKEMRDFLATKRTPAEFLECLKPDVECEEPWSTKGGEPRLVSWLSTPLEEPDGRRYVVITGLDVTERKRQQEQREQLALEQVARAQAEKLNLELEEKVRQRTAEIEGFTYSVSHDMRAPVRALDGFTRILIEEYSNKLDEEGRRLLEIVRANTEKMGHLIDGLLALSRLGRERVVFSEIDMTELARTVFEEQRSIAGNGRRISFKVENLPPAFGDRRLITQVFQNLLGNAVKFTKNRKAATIEVGSKQGHKEVIYYVRDNGVGFDMNYAHKLFGTFQRLHAATEFEGSGIGLATDQRIINRHEGRVWAEAKPGEGATFYFSLPVREEKRAS
ncbi:MAG: response regulator [Acidobacteria bacterium]|nr:response regulator [Acidobacteriota bacterium]